MQHKHDHDPHHEREHGHAHEHDHEHGHEHGHATVSEEGRKAGLQRREFLSILTASFAALGTTGCDFRAPKETVVPHLQEMEGYLPGVAKWYATTCAGCSAGCGVLAKTREGHPIKLEGNAAHPLSQGGLCARGQATVLDLYDSERLQGPLAQGVAVNWDNADTAISSELAKIRAAGGQIRLLTSTVHSPTELRAIEEFVKAFPTASHIVYDALSSSSILDAHEITHGRRVLPWYRIDKAKVIVGFDADFLGTWISPVEFTKAWATQRTLGDGVTAMSWHVQFEPRMSLTGANADLRVPITPSELAPIVLSLASRVGRRVGKALPAGIAASSTVLAVDEALLDRVADELAAVPGRSLILCGSADRAVQVAVNALNEILGNYGNTLDLEQPSLQHQGSDATMDDLIAEMEAGDIGALVVHRANPAYDHPRATEFGRALANVPLSISLSGRQDETAALAKFVCPDHHALESWGDAHPHVGAYSLLQPTVAPLHSTRAAVESLLAWSGRPASAYDFLREVWRDQIFPLQSKHSSFEAFWIDSLHEGVLAVENERFAIPTFKMPAASEFAVSGQAASDGGFEFVAYPSIALGDGTQANNPWLQEMPDPISKSAWGNFATISPGAAKRLDVVEGRIVELATGDVRVELPVQIQPGMKDNVVAAALGYGRDSAGRIAANYPMQKMFGIEKDLLAGGDVYPLAGVAGVSIRATDKMDPLPKSQTQDTAVFPFGVETHPPVQEATLAEFLEDPHAGQAAHHAPESLWPEHEYTGHKWAMAVDLNRCTGCSGCVIACQAENNVPVVGKAEVRKNREMHWIRIDRYYSGTEYGPDDNPDTAFQPMLCQHCDNAPCETVCPVLATVHSTEGLNMQVYNRCVGTRYCANNCPYKVRRFNWFDYAHNDLVQNLVLNPDVTIRTRGIMEKCSMCVQRIYDGKRKAKAEGREPADGEILPACAQSCPSGAIIFGDVNDPESNVAKAAKDPRNYSVLADLGTRPAVTYLTKVRNKKA